MNSKKVGDFEYPNDHDEVMRALFSGMNFQETFMKEKTQEQQEISQIEQMMAEYTQNLMKEVKKTKSP